VFSPDDGMTGKILRKIFQTLDSSLQVFQKERSECLQPFVLLDGNQSKFELEFLSHIKNPTHHLSVCIEVLYRNTLVWQVGDSTERNGNFKVAMNRMKEHTFHKRIATMMLHVDLIPIDITVLVNYVWEHSFVEVTSNKRAICD
jgi:isocitrate dehydrogenase kinase/phosphatase